MSLECYVLDYCSRSAWSTSRSSISDFSGKRISPNRRIRTVSGPICRIESGLAVMIPRLLLLPNGTINFLTSVLFVSRGLAWSKDIRTRPPPSSVGLFWWYLNLGRNRWATWARIWAARSTVACRPVDPFYDTPRLRGCNNWETYPASCDRPRSLLCSNWRNICQLINWWLTREKRAGAYACDISSLNI